MLDLKTAHILFPSIGSEQQDGNQDPGPGVDPELLQQAGFVARGEKSAGGGDDQAHGREPGGEREGGGGAGRKNR